MSPRVTRPAGLRRFASLVAVLLATAGLLALPAFTPSAVAQQVTLPQVSPAATVSQTVGLTEITVDYHRPSVNGRALWGALVPYGEVWRAGANENTTLTFSAAVEVEGQPVPAGTYGLHMVPGETSWQVALSSTASAWGSFTYDESEDVARVAVTPQPASAFAEQLVYGFSSVTRDAATLTLHWGDLSVPIHLATDTDAVVVASLEKELRGIAQYDDRSWQAAANYLAQNQVDDERALAYAERSANMRPGAFNLALQARLLERLGRGDEAGAVLARAEEVATNETEVNLLGYAYLQGGDAERAIATFQRNVDEHPGSWNVYDSLAEAHAAAGHTDRAVELYEKAMEMAPEDQHPRIRGALAQLAVGGGGQSAD